MSNTEADSTAAPAQDPTPTGTGMKPQAGRFIEIISTDGSRASAEDPSPTSSGTNGKKRDEHNEVPEMEMRAVPSNTPLGRISKKSTTSAQVQRSNSTSNRATCAQYNTPSTENSTKIHTSSNNHDKRKHHQSSTSNSSSHHHRHKDGEGQDREADYHRTLSALYPLTHFLGFRPLSHPHTPPQHRLYPSDAGFNRFHYLCGRFLSFGLPPTGSSGSLTQYRNPHTGELELVRMYRDQSTSHILDTIHTVIAAFGIIALLSLLSRSPFHRAHRSPLIIGAFATEAVVSFYAYRTPLAQPKNIMIGNTISAVIGVAIQLAFSSTSYSVSGVYGKDWAAAATSVAAAVLAMELLGVVHPPGAAFALLSVTSEPTERLGWWLVPITVIGSCVVVGWAIVVNNLGGRRWPENWLYNGGVSEVPVIGPERLPFANSSFESPRRSGAKRKREEQDGEKGFYKVSDSGIKLNTGYTAPKPSTTRLNTARKPNDPVTLPSKTEAGSGQDGRTTRASQLTKVDSTPQPPQPAVVVSRMIEDPTLNTSVARNNSKASRTSRRSVVVHVNENVQRMSVGTPSASGHGKKASEHVPAVPAVQWRSPESNPQHPTSL